MFFSYISWVLLFNVSLFAISINELFFSLCTALTPPHIHFHLSFLFNFSHFVNIPFIFLRGHHCSLSIIIKWATLLCACALPSYFGCIILCLFELSKVLIKPNQVSMDWKGLTMIEIIAAENSLDKYFNTRLWDPIHTKDLAS